MKLRILIPLVALLLIPIVATAHPMGNFSINHHSTIRFGTDAIDVRYILDFAEIPTYQMFPNAQTDSVKHFAESWAHGLRLDVNGARRPLQLRDVRSEIRTGAGGLSTLRVEMDLSTAWAGGRAAMHFKDESFTGRIGWKEIVVEGVHG